MSLEWRATCLLHAPHTVMVFSSKETAFKWIDDPCFATAFDLRGQNLPRLNAFNLYLWQAC
jgi:uncharacterized protein (DUF1330 family)